MLKELQKQNRKQMIIIISIGLVAALVMIPFYEWNTARGITCCILGGLGAIAAILALFSLLTNQDVAALKKTISRNGWSMEEIEEDMGTGYDKPNCHIGHKYMLLNSGWKWSIYLLHDIIWIYPSTQITEHRRYGIKTGTSVAYGLTILQRDGTSASIEADSEGQAQNILHFFKETQPHIILGYSEQLYADSQRNLNRLIQFSEEKEREAFKG